MLLSRAFTTVGWARGIAIGFSVFGGFLIRTKAKKENHLSPVHTILQAAFTCFALAFTVSMFDTDKTHAVLIALGSAASVFATCPCRSCSKQNSKEMDDEPELSWQWFFNVGRWQALWVATIVSMTIFLGFWVIDCAITKDKNCPALRSWWYVSEYLFFGLLLSTVAFTNVYLEMVDFEGRNPRF
jgi:hypothetical protein